MKTTLNQLKDAVNTNRDSAQRIAKTNYPVVISRGITIKADNVDDGGYLLSRLTKKELMPLIEFYVSKGAKSIYLQGGFNGADSVTDYADFNYDSWVSEWDVLIIENGEWVNEYLGRAL